MNSTGFRRQKSLAILLDYVLSTTNSSVFSMKHSMDSIPFPFRSSSRPLASAERRHGPFGYTIYTSFKPWLRDEHDYRCVYCLTREAWNLSSNGNTNGFGVDHMRSRCDAPIDKVNYNNLCYCCNNCNSLKGARSLPQRLIDEPLGEHVRISEDGTVLALTEQGEWLRDCLLLASEESTKQRKLILELHKKARYDLDNAIDSMIPMLFEYPSNLDDLSSLNPPQNSRPRGLDESAWARRQRAELPRFY